MPGAMCSLSAACSTKWTGRQAFQFETTTEVLDAILMREPDLSAVPSNLNPRIHDLLRRCLEKSAKGRWQAVGDLRVEIEAVLADPRGVFIEDRKAATVRPLWKRAIPVIITGI